jgi:hypothetical protein
MADPTCTSAAIGIVPESFGPKICLESVRDAPVPQMLFPFTEEVRGSCESVIGFRMH